MNILNKFKRGLAALLSLSVAVSAVFVFHFPLIRAYADDEGEVVVVGHTHTASEGGADGDWKPWPPQNEEVEEGEEVEYPALPDSKGYYYLTANVEIEDSWMPEKGTYLCLNGHSIIMGAEGDVITVNDTFTLCNCQEEGTITHSSGNGCGINNNDGTFNMYGGTISNNTAENGGGINNNGTLNMYGGTISNNTAENGGGVYNNPSCTFYMYGGNISENTAKEGGGVYNFENFYISGGTISENTAEKGGGVYDNSTMTVGGTVKITGNKTIDETPNNVYIPNDLFVKIFADPQLYGADTEIGVTTESLPDEETNVKIANVGEKNYRLFFSSDNKEFKAIYKNNNILLSTSEPNEDDGAIPREDPKEDDPTPTPGDEHTHDGITWVAFDESNLPNASGSYFLEDEVNLSEPWTIPEGANITLCLNGKKLTTTNTISVVGDLTICNCNDKGKGEIHSDNVDIVIKIDGGNLTVIDSIIYSGSGSGVEFSENGGSLTVGGTAQINDVVLPTEKTITIDEEKPLNPDVAKIYVKTNSEPTKGEPIPITGEVDEVYSKCFESSLEAYETKYENKTVVLAVKEQEIPGDKHEQHGENDTSEWIPTDTLPTTEGHYYLTKSISVPADWSPAKGTYLCLNGYKISGTLPVNNSGFTLCDCKGNSTAANATVSAGNKITVGGKLKANITLNKDALIDVDSEFPLTTGASITVAPAEPLEEGDSVTIKNTAAYSSYFKGAAGYDVEVVDGIVKLKKTEEPVVDPTAHKHPFIDDKDYKEIEWTAWNSSTTLPEEKGSYYLTDDVILTSQWKPQSDIDLCLNGYTITLNANDAAVIYVTKDLSLCDCDKRNSTGIITHAADKTGRGVYIASSGALTMYGGIISGNRTTDGAGVYNDGVFTMRGGAIRNNTATNYGGGLYNSGIAVVEGEIYQNSASKRGGGVYEDGKLTVNKNAYIMKNTVGSSKNNVYLTDGSQITIGGTSFDGEVGVTLQTNPKSSGSVTFAKGAITNSTASKLKSDSSSYKIVESGDKLTIARKTTSSDDDSDLELDIVRADSSDIPKADRTAIINLLKTMPNWVVGAYYDVTLYEDGEETDVAYEYLDVELTIPSGIRATNRVYKVIRVHDGEAKLLDDIDSDPNTVTVRSKLFSTYAIIYSVSQNGAANGSGSGSNGSGSNGGYGNPAMGVQNEIPLAGLACGFTVLALAAPGKKLEQ